MSINNIGNTYRSVRDYNYQSYINSYERTRARTQSYSSCCCSNPNPINFLTDYHNTMLNLVSSADALRDINSSEIMGDYTASSSNENVASAALRWQMNTPKDITLDVDNVAKAQKNVSNSINGSANATSSMSFQIAGAKTANIYVHSQNSDGTTKTNRQMLEDAARQINNSKSGFVAGVVENNGMVSLEIESGNTGTSNQFSITGSLGAAAGIDQVAVNAENAKYRVTSDGKTTSHTSESNEIWLETGKIGVSLKGTGKTNISVHSNNEKIASAFEDLIKYYNHALELLSDNTHMGTGVMRQLKNLSRRPISVSSLKDLGLRRNGDGTLSFDKDTFKNNLKQHPDMTKKLLSGQFGFAQRVYQKALNGLSANPASLLNLEGNNSLFCTKPNYYNYNNHNSLYGSNGYRYYNNGWLFDRFM